MQKQAPSLGRIATMVLFALSCFGLLLFLWLSFGGPVPLKPQGFRFKVAFPEATQLGEQVKAYADTFGAWIETVDRLSPSLAIIDMDSRQMLPVADEIIASAGKA